MENQEINTDDEQQVNDVKVSKYNKTYYDTFKEKHSEKLRCEVCKCYISYYAKANHLKSRRHKNALEFDNPK